MDRRAFLQTALAASALALSARRAWADSSSSGAPPSTLTAAGTTGKAVTLTAADIKDFRAGLRGKLLLAQDDGYDQARRIWNGVFDRNPALIARCAETADVVQALRFARAHGLLTAVKAGGHSISGQSTCEGGLMIDLSLMKGIRVDAQRRIAAAQAGVLLGELDQENQSFGLATTLGTASDTGIAGLTLGGGMGQLMRKFGLSCDNLRAVDIVTANGKVLHASEHENADLFWGVRGGGGNFGIVTNFEYQLHPLSHPVLAGGRLYPFSQARTVFAAMLDIAERAPDELSVSGGVLTMAPDGPVPPGRYVGLETVYCGEPSEGEKLLAPWKKLGKPLLDTITAKSYVDAQKGPAGASPPPLPPGLGVYIKSGFLTAVSDQLVDEILHAFDDAPAWLGGIGFGAVGGAVSRVKPGATAYWNRDAKYDLIMDGEWSDHSQDQHNTAVLRDLWKRFEPYTKGYYINTEPSADEQRLRATYGDNYPRLVQLKNRYDPTNLLRLNANIKPAASRA
jgi:FAD/FMN-containing dehydrogenase